jgi:sulfur-oxidizing protein SoxX
VDRLNQDETQRLCSQYPDKRPKEIAKRIEALNLKLVKYPADGKLLGDWKEGEKIAQSGVGKQFSDNPAQPAGGNCYACHQLTKQEISFGNIGPSLYNYGKLRGNTDAIQKYTYGKIYNADAYLACTNMPRFGHNGILTEQQILHVTALLLDPNSPVNQ